MRIVTWNMGLNDARFQQPGLHDQAWHFLLGLGADLAFLQECRPPGWVRAEGALVSGAFQRWASVLFSPRFPLRPASIPGENRLRTLGAYVALGTATLLDGTDAFVASIHARPKPATARQLGDTDARSIARKSVGRPNVNDLAFYALDPLVGSRFIAAGDWNTGRTQANAEAGAEFFIRLERAGWYDAAWEINEHRETRTWFGRSKSLVQDDHVFCDETLGKQVRSAWAAADAATALGLSDHAPLVVDIEMEAIAMTNLRAENEPQARSDA